MIQLLDCTLRDGTHVNSGAFGYEKIISIIKNLSESKMDFVEIGFLRNVHYDKNFPFYPKIEKAYEILDKIGKFSDVEYALMARADEYDLKNLSDCDGKIKYIRIAFYYDYLEKAIQFAKEVIAKGYKITLNLINTPGNDIKNLEKFIDNANEIMPNIVTIVDTFGVLYNEELNKIVNLYNLKLNSTIKLGLHVHENCSMGFSLAQNFIFILKGNRDIVVDGSLMGMGRIPGNLCIELISNYLNENYNKYYNLDKMLYLIDNIVKPIKEKLPWGYSPEYFLSAKYCVHRSYSEYLMKNNIMLEDIKILLSQIDSKYAEKFNKEYIKSLLETLQKI